jgi:glycosyltransferase involved in cell wall biosynthesis
VLPEARPAPSGDLAVDGEAAGVRLARHRWLRAWLERLLGIRLGIMCQYAPRPLIAQPPYPCPPRKACLPFSIVTPSYQQGRFLESTIQSVLGQDYPGLEYIVQDGGSCDETQGVLARYRHRLFHCASVPDRGQSHAINRGFQHATGEILAYLNSDDLLLPGAVCYVADFFHRHPDVDVVYGHRVVIDEAGAEVGRWIMPPHRDAILSWVDYIPQETLFWRRRIWDRVGAALDESFQMAMDWDLLLRFRDAGARFARLPRFLGAYRVHPGQKTSAWKAIGASEVERLHRRYHGRPVGGLERYCHMLPYLCHHAVLHRLYQLRACLLARAFGDSQQLILP